MRKFTVSKSYFPLVCLVSALLLALSYPRANYHYLAWIAVVPLLFLCVGKISPPAALWGGLLTGMVFYTATMYWIATVMMRYGGLGAVPSVLIGLLLALYLSLYFALFTWLVRKMSGVLGKGAALLCAPFLWTALEFLRNNLLTGVPWNLLGHSQYGFLHIVQISAITGIYGVSFLIMAVNACLCFLILPDVPRKKRALILSAVTAVMVACMTYGELGLRENSTGDTLTVGLIQGNVAQDDKIGRDNPRDLLRKHLALSVEAAKDGAELIVWPESSVPLYLEKNKMFRSSLEEFTRKYGCTLVLGNISFAGDAVRNSAFTISAGGVIQDRYDKRHLVPFGEYVPLGRILFFAGPLVKEVGDFEEGDRLVINEAGEHKFAVPICYEIIFPENIRRLTSAGAEFIVNITNDAWFGRSSAPEQHFSNLVFRAVENSRYIVRAANTGISGAVSPRGEILDRTDIFETAYIVTEIRPREKRTFYVKCGDVFAWLCVAVSLLMLGGMIYMEKVRVYRFPGK